MDLILQRQLAIASKLSYEGSNSIEDESRTFGLDFVKQHNVRNHSVSMFHFTDSAIIAFRGTNELADWKTNLLMVPIKRTWGWAHFGFVRAAEELWPLVKESISGNFGQGRKLYITGHSLGGAIAVISALKLTHELRHEVAGLITFGQPPVVGKTAIQSLSMAGLSNYPRNISSVDIVCTGPFMPFFHAGSVQYFDANGQLHKKMSWLRYFQDAARLGWRLQPHGQLKKHFMTNYVSLIENQVEQDRLKRSAILH